MRARAGQAKTIDTYPGQCVHEWAPSKDGQTCTRPNCGSTCRRGEGGKIESYSAGTALMRTPAPKRRGGGAR